MEDLTGQKFGRLTVIEYIGIKNNRRYYKCKCSCKKETEVSVSGTQLKLGRKKSCGCLHVPPKNKKTDLTNKVFGRLTVLGRSTNKEKEKKYRRRYWICRCTCNNIIEVSTDNLLNKGVHSCGCQTNLIDLKGKKFGNLIVNYRSGKDKHGRVKWNCTCLLCNKTKNMLGVVLTSGSAISCGCAYRYGSGKDHPNYNPNLTDEERHIGRKYKEYTDWRKQVFIRDNFTCLCCGKKDKSLQAHHKESYHANKELRVELNNGVTLCKSCHHEFHKIYGMRNNTEIQFLDYINRKKLKKVI